MALFERNVSCSILTSEQLDFDGDVRLAKRPWVLLIEDDQDQSLYFETMLSKAGMRVSVAASAEHGFNLMSRNHFDVVVTDLMMPEISGFELVEALRKLRAYPQAAWIPIIALTACGAELAQQAVTGGADKFCEKRHAKRLLAKQIYDLLARNDSQ